MSDFIIKKLPYDLTSNAGLALVGQYFKRLGINQRIDPRFPISGRAIANSDILKSYLGLMVQGKNDFDAIEAFRTDAFFSRCRGIGCVPSSPTLRQRMDTHSACWFDLAEKLNFAMLSARYAGQAVDFGALPCGYMPVDWGVQDRMGLSRLPSGKFDTNYLVCAPAAIAMNILRLMGQNALLGKDAPIRHAATRRRIKTVMQELMYTAGRMIKHAGRRVLGITSRAFWLVAVELVIESGALSAEHVHMRGGQTARQSSAAERPNHAGVGGYTAGQYGSL